MQTINQLLIHKEVSIDKRQVFCSQSNEHSVSQATNAKHGFVLRKINSSYVTLGKVKSASRSPTIARSKKVTL